jgi:hypothetical protein
VIDEGDTAIPILVDNVDDVVPAIKQLLDHPSPLMRSHG